MTFFYKAQQVENEKSNIHDSLKLKYRLCALYQEYQQPTVTSRATNRKHCDTERVFKCVCTVCVSRKQNVAVGRGQGCGHMPPHCLLGVQASCPPRLQAICLRVSFSSSSRAGCGVKITVDSMIVTLIMGRITALIASHRSRHQRTMQNSSSRCSSEVYQ